ncbi:MAG: hypothetical protein L3J28_00260 [Candidatus Polarisedimenticolaceae bacterium]|nr:hypothetical protein [Candidatus Polarisedimenticolaceae bacterium]
MNKREIAIYESLAKLSIKQLASIARQLEADAGRFAKIRFVYRNSKIKNLLEKLWLNKGGSANEDAGKEIMADLDLIQNDEVMWPGFTETEIEYLRMIFHGMHDVLPSEDEPEEVTEVTQGSTSVSVAMPIFNKQ